MTRKRRWRGLCLATAICVLLPFLCTKAEAATSVLRGVDISYYQGTVNWSTVKNQVDFVILHCGYGQNRTSQDDVLWESNANACSQLGIPFGVYLYSYATTDEAALSEAQHILRLVSGYELSYPIYLDLEDASILQSCSAADILRHVRIFCQAIENAGYTAGVYANLNWWNTYLTSSEYDQWSRWVAQYNSSCGYTKSYDMWQYTDKGTLAGVSGVVDLNYWYGASPETESVSWETMPSNGSRFVLNFSFPSCSFVDVYITSLKTNTVVATGQRSPSDSLSFENTKPLEWGSRFRVELIPNGDRSRTHYVLYGDEPDVVTFPDVLAPVIADVTVSDVTAEGYTVSCTVTDNVGVTRVQFPTWTSQNGQDDLIWHEGTLTGNTASCTVPVSEHGGERGCDYITHIYAWDAAGNGSCATDAGLISVPEEAVPPVMGDVNGDGEVDRDDVRLISLYDVGLALLADAQLALADVNADGLVNAGDVVILLQNTAN